MRVKQRNLEKKNKTLERKKSKMLNFNQSKLAKLKEKQFNSDYSKKLLGKKQQIKTHFKAATDVAYRHSPQNQHKPLEKRAETEETLLKPEMQRFVDKITVNPFATEERTLANQTELEKFKEIAANENLFRRNKIRKNLSFLSQVKMKEGSNLVTKAKMNNILFNQIAINSIQKDSERIKIGEQSYERSEIDKIAKKMLHKCNFFHTKSKNNDAFLKKGEGKLCFTNGMTVSEFAKTFSTHY